MFTKLQGRAGHYLLLLAAGLFLFVNNLGGPSLWDLDEGRNATAALEMLESGNFVVPTFNAQLRVDKPVLLYWFQIASFQLFGINEFAARFPSALAALGTLFLCYELGRALFCPCTALLSALILSSTAMMIGAGRFANPDALLNLFIVSMLTLFWRGFTNPSASWFIGLGVLLGLGALAKGPVGVLLPSLVVATFLAWEKRQAVLWDRRIWYGVLALTIVAAPWYTWVAVETRGAFLQGFLGYHNMNRFLHAMDRHAGPPFYYALVLLVGMAPWSLFLVFATWYGAWSMVRQPWPRMATYWQAAGDNAIGGAPPSAPAYRFLGAWLTCYLVFFSVAATKLPNYLLPAAVPFALLSGRFFDRWRLGEIHPARWVMRACLFFLASVGVVTALGLALVAGRVPFRPFTGPFIAGLETWGPIGLIPLGAALLGFWNLRRHRPTGVVLSFVAGTIAFLGSLVGWVLPSFNQIKATRPLVEQTPGLERGQDIRIGGYQMEHLPSLNFYAQRGVSHQATDAEALAFLRYQVPVYLFLPAPHWERLKPNAPATCRLVAHHPDLYRFNDIVVVTNCAR